MTVLLIAAGGLIGVLARYGLGTAVSADNQPWMIFAINMAGSCLLGVVMPWSEQLSEPVRAAIAVGFCGGFTTFSTVSVQSRDRRLIGDARAFVPIIESWPRTSRSSAHRRAASAFRTARWRSRRWLRPPA